MNVRAWVVGVVAVMWMVVLPGTARAQETIIGGCMEENAGFDVGCTANDIQIARATNIVVLDDGCAFPGDTVHFQADFEVVLNAQERHDLGLYFAIDGDPDGTGAEAGQCSVSTVAYAPEPDRLDLDGLDDGGFCANDATLFCEDDRHCKSVGGVCNFTQDLCGDIDDAHSPLFPTIEVTTACIDPDGNNVLNFPYCTSWLQPGANTLCLGPEDAYPGSPSKCNCDPGFEVDIFVPAATLTVVKDVTPTALDEPGGLATFSVSVTNDSPFATMSVDVLDDDVYGDITVVGGDIASTTCAVPQSLVAGATYACTFDALVSGSGDDVHTDIVTATGVDENGNPVTGSDDATVNINDLLPAITVTKDASPTTVDEPGADVTFTVRVDNNSGASDPVTIDTLVDDVHGDLSGQGDCAVPQVIQPGASYTCSFGAFVAGAPGDSETDTVTATGTDDEGNPVSGSDTATVTVTDVPSSIEVVKTASPTQLSEPGGLVTYTFTVNNTSAVDSVTLDSLVDSILGDLNGQGDCAAPQVVAAGGSYTCSVTTLVSGNANDTITNVVTVSATDDDGTALVVQDDATVTVNDAAPAITVTKDASPTTVDEPGANVTFTVRVDNDSVASDPVTIDALVDDVHGDLNGQGDCAVPQVILPGASYTCSFTAFVGGAPGDTETDLVTASGTDDDGTPVSGSDTATVTVTDVPSSIEVVKTASPTQLSEPGGLVTYTFTVNNTSAVDSVTLDSLVDSILGDLNGQGDCAAPQVVAAGGSYTCSVTTLVSGNANDTITNVVTVSATDDDGTALVVQDDATVTVNDVAPAASLTKTATGAVVTFEVVVTNDSTAESLQLVTLIDDVFGDVTLVQGDVLATSCVAGTMLAPSGSAGDTYTCSFDGRVTSTPHVNTVTGTVSDDEGASVQPSDSAQVDLY